MDGVRFNLINTEKHPLCSRTSAEEIARGGRWAHAHMFKSYLTNLPALFMLSSAGFSTRTNYLVLRADASCTPPDELLKAVLPEVDAWDERFAKVSTIYVV